MEEAFEVVQKINPARLIQLNLEALNAATSVQQAALHVANLYQNLRGIQRVDGEFQGAWQGILKGTFLDHVAQPELRVRLSWQTVWAARAALQDLMERHGMSFQAQLEDPLDERERSLHQFADEHAQAARHDAAPRPGEDADGDEEDEGEEGEGQDFEDEEEGAET